MKKGSSKKEPLLGAHMSTAGGVATAFERARKLGINTFQLFVKNNKRWISPDLKPEEIQGFHEARKNWRQPGPIIAHASYLLNLGTSEPRLRQKSLEAILDEMTRANQLGVEYLVFHPGSHTGMGVEPAIRNVIDALNWLDSKTKGFQTKVALEATAGQGSSLGRTFEELASIREGVQNPDRYQICLDTCHLFASGYDFRTPATWDAMIRKYDEILGLDTLIGIHVNDSKGDLGSRLDRHEHIGKGKIGLEAFRLLMNDPRLTKVPKLLETPKDKEMTEDFENLATLRNLLRKQA